MRIFSVSRELFRRPATALLSLFFTGIVSYGQTFPLLHPLTLKWTSPTGELTSVSPAGGEGSIYLPLSDGRVTSLRAADGELLWNADVGGEVAASPFLDSTSLYVASEATAPAEESDKSHHGVLRALSSASGIAVWVHTFPTPLEGALAVQGQLIFASSASGTIYAIDKRTGELRWTFQSPHKLTSPLSIDGSRILFGTEDGYLTSLDQRTGTTLWHYRTPAVIRSPIIVVGNSLFFGTGEGFVFSLTEKSGGLTEKSGGLVKLWRQRAGTGVQSIQLTRLGILVTTQDNFVMLFELKHGRRLWKKQMPARVTLLPLLGVDSALFTPIGEEACIALSLSDGRQINTIFLGKDNSPIASPFASDDTLFVSTRAGLLAFAPSR